MKKPKIGDWILHNEPFHDRISEGEVAQLLSAQFVYKTKDGHWRMCLYNENWRKAKGVANA